MVVVLLWPISKYSFPPTLSPSLILKIIVITINKFNDVRRKYAHNILSLLWLFFLFGKLFDRLRTLSFPLYPPTPQSFLFIPMLYRFIFLFYVSLSRLDIYGRKAIQTIRTDAAKVFSELIF